MNRRPRLRPAFTLIDLVAALAFIALAAAVVAPILGRSRMTSQAAASTGNLKQMGVAQLAYAGDHQDAFCNPFDKQNPVNYGLSVHWYAVLLPGDVASGTSISRYWEFRDTNIVSMMFAPHWTSFMADYIDNGNRLSGVQFAPQDRSAIDRFRREVTDPVFHNLDALIWDGSYWMSPTLWLNTRQFGLFTPVINPNTSNAWNRNRLDHAASPSAKVMVWERFDFAQKNKRLANGRNEDAYPNWNNPDANPRFCTVDGSVGVVSGKKLVEWAAPVGPNNDLHPSGFWQVPQSTLGNYDMGKDGLENGASPYDKYLAFFWATRNGVSGRDLNR